MITPSPTTRSWRYEHTDLDGKPFPLISRGGRRLPMQPERITVIVIDHKDSFTEHPRIISVEIVGQLTATHSGGPLLGKRHYWQMGTSHPGLPNWAKGLAMASLRHAQAERHACEAYKELGASLG